jgi:pimeloyl-ACP methyl ester carboxylesterase
MTETRTLETPEVTLTYDVHGPLPTADGRPPLLLIGQPMCADGFATLVTYLPDRTMVTYDVRGLGRSSRTDGRTEHTPADNATDVHAIIEAVGGGPVELFGSSGGAVTALDLITRFPGDLSVAVAHEPPVLSVLPDAANARAAEAAVQARYHEAGSGAGFAAFMGLTSWKGEFTAEYLAQPAPDPAQFGMPTEDDGRRDDPLLCGDSNAVTAYVPDLGAIQAAPTRLLVAVGEESAEQLPGRAGAALAAQLGQQAMVFPSHHGGFQGGEHGYGGQPEAFAARLREVLDEVRNA